MVENKIRHVHIIIRKTMTHENILTDSEVNAVRWIFDVRILMQGNITVNEDRNIVLKWWIMWLFIVRL